MERKRKKKTSAKREPEKKKTRGNWGENGAEESGGATALSPVPARFIFAFVLLFLAHG